MRRQSTFHVVHFNRLVFRHIAHTQYFIGDTFFGTFLSLFCVFSADFKNKSAIWPHHKPIDMPKITEATPRWFSLHTLVWHRTAVQNCRQRRASMIVSTNLTIYISLADIRTAVKHLIWLSEALLTPIKMPFHNIRACTPALTPMRFGADLLNFNLLSFRIDFRCRCLFVHTRSKSTFRAISRA